MDSKSLTINRSRVDLRYGWATEKARASWPNADAGVWVSQNPRFNYP